MFIVLLFIFTSATICFGNKNIDLGNVIFANVLYRHGDRTPTLPYPNDPYKNESLWPVPYGQLTNVSTEKEMYKHISPYYIQLGKNQQLRLGKWLRNRYSHLLSDLYSPYDIYIQSTDVDRTLMSAEANLAGLYPPRGNQLWNKINWMPIPVHTIPESEDSILAGKKYCARYQYELDKVLNSPEIQEINKKNKHLYDYLIDKTGMSITSLKDIEYLYDTLYIEALYNRTLPEWTKTVFPDKLKPLASKSFMIHAYNKILQRLKIGSLLGEMVDHMEKKSRNALLPNRKLWMYSAHDETVANMLMTLDLFDPHCPPYTATILIELRVNSENGHFVTISYKNTTEEPNLLILPGCTVLCPLNKFIELTKNVIPYNWQKECMMEHERAKYSINTAANITILTSSILILVCLVLLIIGFVYWHNKREHNQHYLRLTTDPI